MSCCGSLFVNLGGGGGGTVNTGVLQIAGGVPLDSTLRFVEDQAGTDSPIKVSTTSTQILGNVAGIGTGGGLYIGGRNLNQGAIWPIGVTPDSTNHSFLVDSTDTYFRATSGLYFGTSYFAQLIINSNGSALSSSTPITQNGQLTVKGAGGNIASFRDSSNVEQAYITNAGSIITLAEVRAEYYQANGTIGFYFNSKGNITAASDGVFTFLNLANTGFDRLQLGGTTTSFPAIASSNTPATLAAKDATGANLIPFSAEDFTSANLSTGTLITARPMQFGDKGTVTTGNDLGLDAQIAVEHNGNVYYIPCSTSLIT